jgi:hypothetical protein
MNPSAAMVFLSIVARIIPAPHVTFDILPSAQDVPKK